MQPWLTTSATGAIAASGDAATASAVAAVAVFCCDGRRGCFYGYSCRFSVLLPLLLLLPRHRRACE